MSDQNLTNWYPSDVKPVRTGPYKTRFYDGEMRVYFQNWNGEFWGYFCTTPERAAADSNSRFRSFQQENEWMGLASDPNA